MVGEVKKDNGGKRDGGSGGERVEEIILMKELWKVWRGESSDKSDQEASGFSA